ncbi:MAG: dUTP diphosphatase [Candidatus Eremiobacteraeota bacterium]|nr:dUTP diphosphatase [Candidatus Eremiobacteraeota bacterium]
MTAGAAGADVAAALIAPLVLAPGARALVPAGFTLAVPQGYEIQVRPRSGLALGSGVTVLNAPGTIDSDYRGPVGILLVNLGAQAVTIRRGDRIAQLLLAPVARADFDLESEHEPTQRATAGFGSTGA